VPGPADNSRSYTKNVGVNTEPLKLCAADPTDIPAAAVPCIANKNAPGFAGGVLMLADCLS